MTKIQANRLLKLAKHLEKGKLGHEEFNIIYYNLFRGNITPQGINKCGTIGCAYGECPIVWPNIFKFLGVNKPKYIDNNLSDQIFFGINPREFRGLFIDGEQNCIDEKNLDEYATKEEVAGLIRRFVERKIKKDDN